MVCGIGRPLKILNGIKLILRNHLDSYTIFLESFRSFRGPLFHKPLTGQELFFAVSFNKPALAMSCLLQGSQSSNMLPSKSLLRVRYRDRLAIKKLSVGEFLAHASKDLKPRLHTIRFQDFHSFPFPISFADLQSVSTAYLIAIFFREIEIFISRVLSFNIFFWHQKSISSRGFLPFAKKKK